MTKLFQSISRVVAVLSVGMLMGAGAANAAIIRLTFDPAFGTEFPNLWFEGSADITVPAGCAESGNQGQIFPGSATCPDGSIVIEEAHVNLSSTAAPGTTLENVSFAPPRLDGADNPVFDIVVRIIMSQGTVIGIDTDLFGPQDVTAIDGVVPATKMWLQFVSNYSASGPSFTTNQVAYIYLGSDCTTNTPTESNVPSETCVRSDPAAGRFTVLVIPEPGTIALVLAALTILGTTMARRRRR